MKQKVKLPLLVALPALLMGGADANATRVVQPRLNVCQLANDEPFTCGRQEGKLYELRPAVVPKSVAAPDLFPGVGLEGISWENSTPREALEQIIEFIEALILDDDIDGDLGNALIADLDHVTEHLDTGASERLMRGQLYAVGDDVKAGVDEGDIGAEDGNEIGAALTVIIEMLAG